MRQETIVKTYLKFNELNEAQKSKVLDDLYYINVEHDWYDFTYEDALNVHVKINGFDLDRGAYCDIEFLQDPIDTAMAIVKNHGKECDTYKTAYEYLKQKSEVDTFKHDLSEDYRIILQKEYEYLTSEEAIKETIEANNYEFDAETLKLV